MYNTKMLRDMKSMGALLDNGADLWIQTRFVEALITFICAYPSQPRDAERYPYIHLRGWLDSASQEQRQHIIHVFGMYLGFLE